MIKKMLMLVCAILMIGTLAFAGGQKEEAAGEGGAMEKEEDQIEITVIYHDTGIEFGQVIKAGVEAAAKEFGIKADFVGPIGIDVNEQVNFVENAITQEVDGIAVSNVNAEALNPVIDKAIEAGIPAVTFNSEAAGSKRMGFFGQDLVESGRVQGEILVEYMGKSGKVIVVTGEAAASWSQDREKGVRESLAKYPDIEVINTLSTGWEEQQQYAAVENALLANPDITGIASLDAATTPAVGRALLRNDRKDIYHVGHDLVPETLDNIKAGVTNASLSQDPYAQGYLPVRALYEYITEGKEIESVDTGILRVDETNVDEYLEKLENGEPIG